MRVIAEMTGGQLTAFRSADYAFSHLDRATRFEYLLGYIPSNAASNGAFRKISVTVKRAGATVLYRQGYYSTPQLVPLDRQAFITFNRMSAAGRYQGAIEDIKIELNPPTLGGTSPTRSSFSSRERSSRRESNSPKRTDTIERRWILACTQAMEKNSQLGSFRERSS